METFSLMMAGSDDWLTLEDAANYLAKSPHWLYQNRERLRIPHTRIGKTYRFKKSQLDEWISASGRNQSTLPGRKGDIRKILL